MYKINKGVHWNLGLEDNHATKETHKNHTLIRKRTTKAWNASGCMGNGGTKPPPY